MIKRVLSDLCRGGVVLALMCSSHTFADDLREQFASPAKLHRPLIRWWWPGGDVREETVRQQVQLLDEAGFGGAEIQPIHLGLSNDLPAESIARINDYASTRFFELVAAAADEAERLGLQIDYTLGSGWPSGGPAITPDSAAIELVVAHQTVRGPMRYAGLAPMPERPRHWRSQYAEMFGAWGDQPADLDAELKRREKIVAVVAVRGTAPRTEPFGPPARLEPEGRVLESGVLDAESAVVLTDKLRADGTLDWQVPPGEWRIFTFKQFAADLRVIGGVGGGAQLVLDHWNRLAFDAHAAYVLERGLPQLAPHLGHGLRSLFVDSMELQAQIFWSEDLLHEFKERRGYDLTPYLPLIVQPGWMNTFSARVSKLLYDAPNVGDRVRADYRLTLSELMIERFYQPLAELADRHGLSARIQAHGAPVDTLRAYGLASVPETEDLFEQGSADFVRMARSAADIYGRRLVSSEAFVFAGNPYDVTPAQFKDRADRLFSLGVNAIAFHGSPYPYRDDPPPGWRPFRRFASALNQHNPLWHHLRPLNDYIARAQLLLRQGVNAVPIAVYRPELVYELTPAPPAKPRFHESLSEAGYAFDHMNADGLMKSRVERHQLITQGGTTYAALVLPKVAALRLEIAKRLVELAERGLPVIFLDMVPDRDEGLRDWQAHDAEVKRGIARSVRAGARLVPQTQLVLRLRELGVASNLRFVQGGSLPFVERRSGGRRLFFMYNPEAQTRDVVLEVDGQVNAERWDAWSGQTASLRTLPSALQRTRLLLAFQPGESAFIVLDAQERPERSDATEAGRVFVIGQNGWDFRASGYGRGGRTIEYSTRLRELPDWTAIDAIEDLAGTGTYTASFKMPSACSRKETHVKLDLGKLREVAVVKINGEELGTVMRHPFVLDIGRALRADDNRMEIAVANTPANAVSLTTPSAPSTKVSAGLRGPVRLICE